MYLPRQRAGVRNPLGRRRPWESKVPRPSSTRTRTVAGAAKRARLGKDGAEWKLSSPGSVGIDVAKDRLDIAVRPSREVFAVERNGAGLAALCEKLLTRGPAIEATGGFEEIAAASLAGAGLPLVVVNPAQVRSFAKTIGRRCAASLRDDAPRPIP